MEIAGATTQGLSGRDVGEWRQPQGVDLRAVLDALPMAVYTTDAEGTITYYNDAARTLAGREPKVGSDKWCVSYRLYAADGTPMPLDACPMAIAIRERRPVRGVELVAERPNGGRIPIMPFPSPLYDEDGNFTGAVNVLVDVSELKQAQSAAVRRADEQAALYRFTDRLYRAESLTDIHEAALDAISSALGCRRGSVLLFDEAGVMRFVAWRGLSEAYRQAVDGHSPWKAGDRDPFPILISDVAASDLTDDLKRTVLGEKIGALAFIPIVEDGEVIGKFMAYYDEPHDFDSDEVDLAVLIARQLGFSIARERAQLARRRAEDEQHRIGARLRLATEAGKVGLWDWDIVADRITWTDSLYAIHGMSKQDFAGSFADWLSHVHPEDRQYVIQAVDRALAGQPYELEMRTLKPDGSIASLFTNAVVLLDGDRPVRMVGASVDVTERKKTERERDLLVAELSHRVKNTLATVISVARQSFPRSPEMDQARQSFEGRLRAMAQTHTRLAEVNWTGVSLETMLRDELAPYRGLGLDGVTIAGRPLELGPKAAVMLGMGFHELATNAAKYGALSTPTGEIDINWTVGGGELSISWSERKGPEVIPPSRAGFGRLLLERALAADVSGRVTLNFPPEGFRCIITLPYSGGEFG